MTGADRVVLDCRWLGHGGPGRLTELLLRGMGQGPERGRWLLWGPARATAALAWPGAEIVPTGNDPRRLLGQREWRVPDCELGLFAHQQRPLRRLPSVTVVHDTIPLRFARNALDRELKRLFLGRVAALSHRLITSSEYSRGCIECDLGVARERIHVVHVPFDAAQADRVGALRRRLGPVPVAVYVGNFLPHKNLSRLVEAFRLTRFRKAGGRLALVGGTEDELRALGVGLGPGDEGTVEIVPPCPQGDLERRVASATVLVQPSLEEGFGLPAWEALCAGVPVCVSDGGSLPEATRGLVEPFPAASVEALAGALDEAAEAGDGAALEAAAELRRTAPTVVDFARQYQDVVAMALA